MKLSELKAGTGSVNVEVDLLEVGPFREINKYGMKLRVANASIKDDSGTMTLVLWNDQIETVKAGKRFKIENGYVNEWQGSLQLTLGKLGTIKRVV